jgi:hypothetical protein
MVSAEVCRAWIGVGAVGVQRQRAMQPERCRTDRAGAGGGAFGAGMDRDHGQRVARILCVGVLDVAGRAGAEDDVAGRIGAGNRIVEAAGFGGGNGIVVGDRRGVLKHVDGEGLLAVHRAVAGIDDDVETWTAGVEDDLAGVGDGDDAGGGIDGEAAAGGVADQ